MNGEAICEGDLGLEEKSVRHWGRSLGVWIIQYSRGVSILAGSPS